MQYLSCFSGIGGLEGTTPPKFLCEKDPECHTVLSRMFPGTKIFEDIRAIEGIEAPVTVGGWPCQDISVAGKQRGLRGPNSSLFYHFLRAAVQSGSHTIVAENVTHLLRLENGAVFREIVNEFINHGYKYVAWRVLNCRAFGLPHHRSRVFVIASKDRDRSTSIFRSTPELETKSSDCASGFYWTAGTQSICYSQGYTPTIKVGSSLSIPSPPAVHYKGIARQLTPAECIKLQGFNPSDFFEIKKKGTIYRMAGNSVAAPVGKFVVDGVLRELTPDDFSSYCQGSLFEDSSDWSNVPKSGIFDDGLSTVEMAPTSTVAANLSDFIDHSESSRLSPKACAGLLRRLDASGHSCPDDLRDFLEDQAVLNA